MQLEVEHRGQTGLAFIYVDADGENEIGLFPGANGEVSPREVGGAVLCQLEVPDAVVIAAAREASFFALNAAPARPIDLEPDLLVVNEHVSLLEGLDRQAALERACAEGARATTRMGAQWI